MYVMNIIIITIHVCYVMKKQSQKILVRSIRFHEVIYYPKKIRKTTYSIFVILKGQVINEG